MNGTELDNATTPRSLSEQGRYPTSETPETDLMSVVRIHNAEWMTFARKLERSLRRIHAAYRQKVQVEIQLGHYDKGAMTIIEEIQRDHPTLFVNDDA